MNIKMLVLLLAGLASSARLVGLMALVGIGMVLALREKPAPRAEQAS